MSLNYKKKKKLTTYQSVFLRAGVDQVNPSRLPGSIPLDYHGQSLRFLIPSP